MLRILTSSRFYHGTPWTLPSLTLDSPVFLTLDLGTAEKYSKGSVAYSSRRPVVGNPHKDPAVYSVSFKYPPKLLNTIVPAHRQYWMDLVSRFNRLTIDEDDFVSPLRDAESYPGYGQVASMWSLVRDDGYSGMFVAETGRDSSLLIFSRSKLVFSRVEI